jgi:tetratricopeptide (TPR) repeat protein
VNFSLVDVKTRGRVPTIRERDTLGLGERTMTNRIRAAVTLAAAFLLVAASLPAASALFDKGTALFVQNKPAEARPVLEEALTDDPSNETIYLYLGIVYQQLGDPDRAITILKRGLNIATLHQDLFLYNIGNNFFSRGEYTFAEESYTSAVAANRTMPVGYLNRANSRMKLERWDGALADYQLFLQLAPQDPQRPQVEKVVALLQEHIAKQAALAQSEAERQKALMAAVLNSLTNASDDALNLTVESLKINDNVEDVDIED